MQHIIHSSIEVNAAEEIDRRLYIDDLTQTALQSVFSADGRFGFPKAVVFNRTAKKFYHLKTYNSKADVINPTNWDPVGSNVVAFPQFVVTEAYNIGSCIFFTNTLNYTSFYIGLSSITAGQSPETNPELWFDLKGVSSTGGGNSHQETLHRLDPGDVLTHEFIISILADISDNGTKIPTITLLGDFGETISANTVWEELSPSFQFYTESGIIKCNITFTGDVSSLNFNGADANQKNIKIIFR